MNRWVEAARLRTLPLALSVCFAAAACAMQVKSLNYAQFALLVTTIISLQILSNYANDLGDFQNGGDDALRNGPRRQVQSGAIQPHEMKVAVAFMALLSLIFGISLLLTTELSIQEILLLFLCGISAIWAAIRYTAGKDPYGYRALGDLSVFIFFGPVGVCGSAYLLCGEFSLSAFLFSIISGCLAMMVLNLNNLRDESQDRRTKKTTMIVKWGSGFGLMYNRLLFFTAVLFSVLGLLNFSWIHVGSSLLVLSFLAYVQRRILFFQASDGYDQLMKPTALLAFLFSLIHFVLCIFTL
jgi:1,4-dihydroxy-2-naphthoate octaprenyltransferase